MKELASDWLTKGLIDFEFKKYQLLAYLKHVSKCYSETKLYPQLGELVFHYNNILALKNNKLNWADNFPKTLKQIDIKRLQLQYQEIIKDDELMSELDEVIEFAIPNIKQVLLEGRDIYEYVESKVSIAAVGLTPLYKDEGYFFIHQSGNSDLSTFRYGLRIFENAEDSYRGIETTYLGKRRYRKFDSLKSEKMELVRRYKELPNPATYFITTTEWFPFEETLLPIVKRHLVKYVSTT